MRRATPAIIPVSLVLLLLVLSAGCSEETGPAATPAPSPSAAGPLYHPGDIIATRATAASFSLYIILGYDTASDQYTRALVEKNSDGSWGHRTSNRTDMVSRTVLEKVYTVRVTHIPVSSVPALTGTVVVISTAPVPEGPPKIRKITPSYASRGSAMSFFITGENFMQGATVKLISGGSAPLAASGLTITYTGITGVFDLTGKPDGAYMVTVTNPDGQSDDLPAGVTIGEPLPVITSVNPVSAEMGRTIQVSVYGQNFRNNIRVLFTSNTTDLTCTNPMTTESAKISCTLRLDRDVGARPGEWTLSVLNVDTQKKSTWTRKFTITNATS